MIFLRQKKNKKRLLRNLRVQSVKKTFVLQLTIIGSTLKNPSISWKDKTTWFWYSNQLELNHIPWNLMKQVYHMGCSLKNHFTLRFILLGYNFQCSWKFDNLRMQKKISSRKFNYKKFVKKILNVYIIQFVAFYQ